MRTVNLHVSHEFPGEWPCGLPGNAAVDPTVFSILRTNPQSAAEHSDQAFEFRSDCYSPRTIAFTVYDRLLTFHPALVPR